MNEVSREDREIVREELASIAEFLHVKRGLSIKKARQYIREMLDVSV